MPVISRPNVEHIDNHESRRALRTAVIGAGLMGRWHAEAIRSAGGLAVAVVDRDLDSARRLAARFPRCAAFGSAGEMLARIAPDVVHVCTPAHTHRDIAEGCAEAGAHLIVEKPLTPCAREAEELFRRTAERSLLLCPVHQQLFQRGVMRASTLLAEIGDVVDVQASFCSAGAVDLPHSKADAIAADILPHPLSLFGRLFNRGFPDSALVARRPAPGELRVYWESRGAAFSIRISMNGRPTRSDVRITGARGTLHLDLFHGFGLLQPGRVSRFRKILQPFDLGVRIFAAATVNMARRVVRWEPAYPGLLQLVREFHNAVRSGGAAPVSPEEAIATARARDRILESV